jgi:hypothetical protein
VVEWEGEPRVVDTVLGAALGYGRPERIRDLIQGRADLFRGAGNLPRRAVNSDDPGRGRPSREFLLNREQVNLAILLCGLPNVDGVKAPLVISPPFPARIEEKNPTDLVGNQSQRGKKPPRAGECGPNMQDL